MGNPQEKGRAHQPMLPGMERIAPDLVTKAILAFTADLSQSDKEDAARTIRRALVLPAQRVVFQEYEEQALRPRRDIWGQTTDILLMNTPRISWHDAPFDSQRYGEVEWNIPRLVHESGHDLEVTTKIETRSITLTGSAEKKALGEAMQYYVHGRDMYPWKRIPDSLLGVPYEGEWGVKGAHFPKNALAQRITEEALRLTDNLYVTVTSQVLGSSETKQLVSFHVANENEQVPYHLDPQNADDLLRRFHSLDDNDIPAAANDMLRREYLGESSIALPEGYKQLAEVNTFLAA